MKTWFQPFLIVFQMSFCLSNLILTGHATPFMQDGVVRELWAKTHS